MPRASHGDQEEERQRAREGGAHRDRRGAPDAVREAGDGVQDASALDLGEDRDERARGARELSTRARSGSASSGRSCPASRAEHRARGRARDGDAESIEAFSVSRACATSFQAMTSAAEAMLAGSTRRDRGRRRQRERRARSPRHRALRARSSTRARRRRCPQKLRAFAHLGPRDFLPVPPALKEPTTGSRWARAPRRWRRRRHLARRAGRVRASQPHARRARLGRACSTRGDARAAAAEFDDAGRRRTTSCARTRRSSVRDAQPAFDRKYGTITAGNSSPLTDGAAALLLMTESKAKALGYEPLGYLRSWRYAALDPAGGMLMGRAHATPMALERAGLSLADMDLVDMHEAFAAQVLCNVKAFASKEFAREKLGRGEADRRDRRREAQRARRVDRDRAPVRRDRRAHGDDGAERAATERREVRARDRVRGRRARRGGGPRGRPMSAASQETRVQRRHRAQGRR